MPLRLRKETIGSLLLLRSTGRPLGADDLALAQALADAATIGLLHARTIQAARHRQRTAPHGPAESHRHRQAKGLLAARRDISLNAAFEAMRRHARSQRLLLSAVARDVIDTGATLGGPSPAVPPRPNAAEVTGAPEAAEAAEAAKVAEAADTTDATDVE